MSKEVTWMRVESSSRPGRCYYYNCKTKASTWERPPGLEDFAIPSHAELVAGEKRKEVADVSLAKPVQNAWSQPETLADKNKNSISDKKDQKKIVSIKSNNLNPLQNTKVKQNQQETSSNRRMAGAGGDVEEAMEVERWGEEEEVAMDIDVSQEDIADMRSVRDTITSPSQLHIESFGIPADYTNDYTDKLYLVLDTNVLLSHLNFLEELKDYAIKGVGKPVLVIPWIVMQELDKHKSRGNDRLAGKARKAIRLLFSCFTSNHPRVRCQTMEETHTEVNNLAIEGNDDRILHCCLLYQMKTQGHSGIVVLFSNDINLCTKAMGNGVKAADRTTLFKELRSLCQSSSSSSSITSFKQPPLHLKILPPSLSGHTPNIVQITSPTPFTPTTPRSAGLNRIDLTGLHQSKEVSDLLSEAETIIRETLSLPLKQEMIIAFDQLWLTMIAIKPPWSLKDQLFLIEKHWIAVYGQVLPQHIRGVATQLWHSIKNRPGVPSVEEALLFTRRAVSVVQGFRSCTYCTDSIKAAIARLDSVSSRLIHLKRAPPLTASATDMGVALMPSPTAPRHHQPSVAHVPPLVRFPSSSSPSFSGDVTDSTSSLPLLTIPSFTTSSLSLKEKLTLTVQSPPSEPTKQLQWVLGLIHDSVIYSQSMVHETLGSSQTSLDRANVSCFVRQIGELLSQIVSSLKNLFDHSINVPRMQEALVALDFFLCQALLVHSPLAIDTFYELISTQEQRQLLETALKTYTGLLAELQTIDANFHL